MLVYIFHRILIDSGWIAKNMKSDNSVIIEEFELILRSLDRIREGFRIEKEAALAAGSIEALERLRERSKSVYVIKLKDNMRNATRLRNGISPDLPGMEAAEDLAERCMEEAAGLNAHLVSAPNRLIRVFLSGDAAGEGKST